MNRNILVSNRLPIVARVEKDSIRVSPAAGGLATALRGPHQDGDGVWVGWPGVPEENAGSPTILEERLAAFRCVPVHLSREEVTHFYERFSNGVLWPLLHYQIDKLNLDADVDWKIYEAVNRRFAEAVAKIAVPGSRIWVHDYQLALVPAMLRELVTDVSIGFFLHVPFPAPEVFNVLPWRREIALGIAGADLVGFHTRGYARNFLATAESHGLPFHDGSLAIRGRTVRVTAHPIGIDIADFDRVARAPATELAAERIRVEAKARSILLGVDRLDYTKGIPRRLLAFERFLEWHPELRDRVELIQVAVPSRENVEAYAALGREVRRHVDRINQRFGTDASIPVRLVRRSVSMEELVALYRAADVMLVTPLRDGMNLVAKEFVASRVDDRGVLVLSEHAGAALELRDALLVNPYDLGAVAGAIERALTMGRPEQADRIRRLRRVVQTVDASRWASTFLDALELITSPPPSAPRLVAAADRYIDAAEQP